MGGLKERSSEAREKTNGRKRGEYAAPVSYQDGELRFEFGRNGSPYIGLLAVTRADSESYAAEVNLESIRSRNTYARDAAELTGMDADALRKGLNKLCAWRVKK